MSIQVSAESVHAAIHKRHPIKRATIQMDGGCILLRVVKAIWPHNTAANLAAAARLSVSGTEHCLYGRSKWNAFMLAAVIAAIMDAILRSAR